MNIKKYLCFITMLMSFAIQAKPVQTKFQNLKVNANFIQAEDKSAPFYLILHGTWAWQGMELIASTQEILEEESVGSLAITLSLGMDDRKGFLGCPGTITAVHQQSYKELHHWYQYLAALGYNNIVLMSHSRGGSQAAGFAKAYPKDKLKKLVLLAPLAWDKKTVHQQYKKKSSVKLASLLGLTKIMQPHQMMNGVDLLYCKKQNVSAETFLSYYSDKIQRNTWDLVKNLPVPVEVFLGSKDPLSIQFAESIADKKLPSSLKVHTIDGADHFFRDLYLEDIIESILEDRE